MNAIFTFVTAHWTDILGVGAGFVLTFDRLAKITPSTSDDAIVAFAYKVFAFLGVKVQDNNGTPPAA